MENKGLKTKNKVKVTAYEVDCALVGDLEKNLESYDGCSATIVNGDYIDLITKEFLKLGCLERRYTHALLNPPYKKIRSDSAHSKNLKLMGVDATNLYSGFVGLSLLQLKRNGLLVALIPRSFCTGTYFKKFRKLIFSNASVVHLHLFKARNAVFKDDSVLQENVIIVLRRGGVQGSISISRSTDDALLDMEAFTFDADSIVFPDDEDMFIHIPSFPISKEAERIDFKGDLKALDIQVSTGPVVDFRVSEFLKYLPETLSVSPLIHSANVKNRTVIWPDFSIKKPNAIICNAKTEKQLFQMGYYCVVRRFSAQEQHRRIVASVIDPNGFSRYTSIGFENHLNVFHRNKAGLNASLAHGLAAFLNSKFADFSIREFSSHTQVNAADLKRIKYPSVMFLESLGAWVISNSECSPHDIDVKIEQINKEELQ
nr:Eco57I restriction-modification methylase domain-containing protein [Pseudomonas sp. CDFA 610]